MLQLGDSIIRCQTELFCLFVSVCRCIFLGLPCLLLIKPLVYFSLTTDQDLPLLSTIRTFLLSSSMRIRCLGLTRGYSIVRISLLLITYLRPSYPYPIPAVQVSACPHHSPFRSYPFSYKQSYRDAPSPCLTPALFLSFLVLPLGIHLLSLRGYGVFICVYRVLCQTEFFCLFHPAALHARLPM